MLVDDVLISLRGKSFIFVPNPGNAGDGLIAAAEYFEFMRLGLSFRYFDINSPINFRRDDVIVYGGGGNLVGLYNNAKNFLIKIHNKIERLIILPHTIRGHEDLISSFGENVTIFCRDLPSYEHVRKTSGAVSCYKADDMALSLPVIEVLGRSTKLGFSFVDLMTMRTVKRVVRLCDYAISSKFDFRVLNAFRYDAEGANRGEGLLNIDVSQVFSGDEMSDVDCRETAYAFMRFINLFDKVNTDRLHVCIAAALLGKRVDFYDNSYGKNSNVYEFSMKNKFPNVNLIA